MTYVTAEAAQQIEEAFISVCDAFLNDDSHGLYDDAKEALATIREARAQEHSHPDELEDRPVDVELAQYKRMFEAACSSLAAIGDALGVEPEEGGAESILSAIAELKNSPVQQAEQEPDYFGLTHDHTWLSIDKKQYDKLKLEGRMACYAAPQPVSQEPVAWIEGYPKDFYSEEWFIAITIYGDRVVLKALPENYSYDFTTADGTYMKKENVKRWMQFPDSEFLPPTVAAPVRTKDLTDDEILPDGYGVVTTYDGLLEFARAVIAADREKNK